MKNHNSTLQDAFLIELEEFNDDRGYFFELFHSGKFNSYEDTDINFVQDNISFSKKNVLRGLHFQKEYPQGKLVSCLSGVILDVAVDLRKNSKTFKSWQAEILSSENRMQFWIPPGFAHGFRVLSDNALVHYKCTEFYHPEDEFCLIWDDDDIGIDWQLTDMPNLSKKDMQGKTFHELNIIL